MTIKTSIKQTEGFITKILFPRLKDQKKNNSDYYIFELESFHFKKNIIVKGSFPGLKLYKGSRLKLNGNFEYNAKYKSYEFISSEFEEIFPDSEDGIIDFLMEYIPFIGKSTAKDIYDFFGGDLITLITKDPDILDECAFLSQKQKISLKNHLTTNLAFRDAAIYLQKFKLSNAKIKKVYDIYKESTKHLVMLNPYCLVDFGISSFEVCDQIAIKEGFSLNCEERIKSFIIQLLNDLTFSGGHLFISINLLYQEILKSFKEKHIQKFFISPNSLKEFLILLNAEEKIILQKTKNDLLIYPFFSFESEKESAIKISNILKQNPLFNLDYLRNWVDLYEKEQRIEFTKDQKEAILALASSKVIVITGMPGTGKSFLVKTLTDLFKTASKSFSLLAPTGIAAKKLASLTNNSSGTIHRELQWGGAQDDDSESERNATWGFHKDKRYPYEVIILDELSMIDQYVFFRLTDALEDNVQLILIGDSNQLPSVSPGNVLSELIFSNKIKTVHLTEIKRQEDTSDIVRISHLINHGKIPGLAAMTSQNDVTFIETENDEETLEEIKKQVILYKNNDPQIISPIYKSRIGVSNLNDEIREILNPKEYNIESFNENSLSLRENDKIIIGKNNYKKGFFNGEDGFIERISKETEEIEIKLTGVSNSFLLTFKEAEEYIKLSYCLTVHKVQGNEYDTVIIPISNTFYNMLQRNLIYTAITRAKKKVILIGQYAAFCKAITNNETKKRNSILGKRIIQEIINGSK